MNREQMKAAMEAHNLQDGYYWMKRNGRTIWEVCQYNRVGYGESVLLITGSAHVLEYHEVEELGEFLGSEPGASSIRVARVTPTHGGFWWVKRAGKWIVALLDRERSHPNTRVQLQYDSDFAFVSERDVTFGPFVGHLPPEEEAVDARA